MNYFLAGSESYNLRKRRDEIIKSILGKDADIAVSVYRDEKYNAIDEVIDDCTTFSLFSEHKVVVYENPIWIKDSKKKTELDSNEDGGSKDDKSADMLVNYLKNPNEGTTLIIYCEKDLASNSSVVKKIGTHCIYESFGQVNEQVFKNIINKDLNEAKIRLDYRALNELYNRLPLSIENWKRELEKLKLYPEAITVDVIKSLVARELEDNVLNLSNAFIAKNLSLSLQIFHDLLMNNKSIIPPLIGLLASQFRFMCQVKALAEENFTLRDIMAELDVSSDYRIRKTMENCQGKSSKELLEILNDLSDLDQKIKSGGIDPITGFELFITKTIRR